MKKIRLKKQEVAKKAGISGAALSNILSGRRGVSWFRARALAEAFPYTIPGEWMDEPQETMVEVLKQETMQQLLSSD